MFIPFSREFQLQTWGQPQRQSQAPPRPLHAPPQAAQKTRQALRGDGRARPICNHHQPQKSTSDPNESLRLASRLTINGDSCVKSELESMAVVPVRDDRRIVLHLVSIAFVLLNRVGTTANRPRTMTVSMLQYLRLNSLR